MSVRLNPPQQPVQNSQSQDSEYIDINDMDDL